MIERDIAVLSQRYPIKARVELLLGHGLDDRSSRVRSVCDVFAGGPGAPRLVVVDVLKLLSAEVTFLPRLARDAPNMLVVGLREDSDRLIAAWNQGVPADPLEDLSAEILRLMLARSEGGCEFYHHKGRHCAEGVHSFLARRLERRVLTEREAEAAELLRLGWRYARIASYLGLEVQTVKNHASRIYDKLGVSTRHELCARAAMPVPTLARALG